MHKLTSQHAEMQACDQTQKHQTKMFKATQSQYIRCKRCMV